MNLSGLRILVSGGTGFVGRHLTRALADAGAELRCIVRPGSNRAVLPPGTECVEANLSTGEGLAAALAGQEVFVHLAALLFGLGWQDYLHCNARAAHCLAKALQEARTADSGGLRRCVLVSSLAATGPSASSPGVADDAIPSPVSAYGWSKYLTEQILGRALGDRLVVLRPPIIYGSGDKGLLPCFQAAAAGYIVNPGWRRAFPVSAVHVQDMVQAILLCLGGKAHGVYHLNDGAEHSMVSMGQAMAAACGRSARTLSLPLPLMGLAAQCCALWGPLAVRLGQRVPSWNPDKYREAREAGWLCQGARIGAELGFAPAVSLSAGMAEAVAGYREEGVLT